MKKLYSKPEIMFENFTLSTSIAGDCEEPFVGNASRGTCAYIVPGNEFSGDKHVFTSSMIGICTTTEADDEYNGLCYHVFDGGSKLFNS